MQNANDSQYAATAPVSPGLPVQNVNTESPAPEAETATGIRNEQPVNIQVNTPQSAEEGTHAADRMNKTPFTLGNSGLGDLGFLGKDAIVAEEPVLVEYDAADDFTYEDLLKVWDEYAVLVKNKGKQSLHTMLTLNRPVRLNPNLLQILLENKVQLKVLDEERIELLNYLRTKLNNFKITLQHKMVEIKREKMLYTAQEKYEYMVSKNPALDELRRKFNMEIL